jgi:hypothetical protein
MSKRDQVLAVTPSGSSFHLARPDAAVMVRDGAATWSDSTYSRILVNQQGALRLRGLSCRVGPELAEEFRRDKNKQGWAAVARGLIQLALPRKCKRREPRPGYTMLHRIRPAFVDTEKTT